MNHEYSTRAMIFMMFLFIAGAVIAAIGGGGTPNYIVKWNTTDSITDSIMSEHTDLINVSGKLKVEDTSEFLGDVTIDNTVTHTVLTLENTAAGTFDTSFQFKNAGTLEWSICVDDSVSDELEFVRGGFGCSSSDVMALTADGLEMGAGRIYFDRTNSWTLTADARNNNQFTMLSAGASYSSIANPVNGQPIWVVCGVSTSTLVDNAFLGNLQLAGNFDCNSIGDTIGLMYNDRVGKWVEMSRSNN